MGPSQAAGANAGELRAEVARQMVPIYRLAPMVGLHPAHHGQVLRGRRPDRCHGHRQVGGMAHGLSSPARCTWSRSAVPEALA